MSETKPLPKLKETLPQTGRIEWIGLRPEKRGVLQSVNEARLSPADGLHGDHYSGETGKRQLTLIQAEHLSAVGQMLHRNQPVAAEEVRRNVVVSGINLLALRDQKVKIGEAVIEITGLCHPCSRMEENLGPGGYNAMRGHGGLTARILTAGAIRVGDTIALLTEETHPN